MGRYGTPVLSFNEESLQSTVGPVIFLGRAPISAAVRQFLLSSERFSQPLLPSLGLILKAIISLLAYYIPVVEHTIKAIFGHKLHIFMFCLSELLNLF